MSENIAQKFEALNDLYENSKKDLGKNAVQLLQTAFIPGVKSLGFRAYTPYWNDGDRCYYSVHTYDISINGYDNDEELEDEEIKEIGLSLKEIEQVKETFSDLLDKIPDEIIEATFGEGEITIFADGTHETSECDHD